jgi:hypothetical protein
MYEARMSSDRPKRETMSLEEAALSNMWEIAAIVEVLVRKGLCMKQELVNIIKDLREQTPRAKIPETVFPSPCLLSETEERVIDDLLAVLNTHGMDSKQSLDLLEQLGRIIEMGARLTPGQHTETHRLAEAAVFSVYQGSAPSCQKTQQSVVRRLNIRQHRACGKQNVSEGHGLVQERCGEPA